MAIGIMLPHAIIAVMPWVIPPKSQPAPPPPAPAPPEWLLPQMLGSPAALCVPPHAPPQPPLLPQELGGNIAIPAKPLIVKSPGTNSGASALQSQGLCGCGPNGGLALGVAVKVGVMAATPDPSSGDERLLAVAVQTSSRCGEGGSMSSASSRPPGPSSSKRSLEISRDVRPRSNSAWADITGLAAITGAATASAWPAAASALPEGSARPPQVSSDRSAATAAATAAAAALPHAPALRLIAGPVDMRL
mmetsp:Transcript_40271/g.129390  ORF Transcript_40271/g.129390 Transcript_40271/m.129390 type:complete len:248 (+) Transcript_40271:2287-3030(+)